MSEITLSRAKLINDQIEKIFKDNNLSAYGMLIFTDGDIMHISKFANLNTSTSSSLMKYIAPEPCSTALLTTFYGISLDTILKYPEIKQLALAGAKMNRTGVFQTNMEGKYEKNSD